MLEQYEFQNVTTKLITGNVFEQEYDLKFELLETIRQNIKSNPRYRVYLENKLIRNGNMVIRKEFTRMVTGAVHMEKFVVDSYIYDDMFESKLMVNELLKLYKEIHLKDDTNHGVYLRDGFKVIRTVLKWEHDVEAQIPDFWDHKLHNVDNYHESKTRKELMIKISELYGERALPEVREQIRSKNVFLNKWVKDDVAIYYLTATDINKVMYIDRIHTTVGDPESLKAFFVELVESCKLFGLSFEINIRDELHLGIFESIVPNVEVLGRYYLAK